MIPTPNLLHQFTQAAQKLEQPNPILQEFTLAAELLEGKISHPHIKWSDLPDSEKMKRCTNNSGRTAWRKLPDGNVEKVPRYCNLCPKCYEMRANQLQAKLKKAITDIRKTNPNGRWRKKVVETGTEAESLKKHVQRNQASRHIEIACIDNPDKVEIWTYTNDEPGKDMDSSYGKPANPHSIDTEAVYNNNRKTGKKVSFGGGVRPAQPKPKEDTVRIKLPEIAIADSSQDKEAQKIIDETNYCQEAETPEEVQRLILLEFHYILKALEAANIKIAWINESFLNYEKPQLLEDWNTHVKWWMSANASIQEDKEAKTDMCNRLIIPEGVK